MSKPQTIGGRFVLDEVLGEGSMGVVYKGHDSVLLRPVAIKLIKGELGRDDAYVERFLTEGRIVAQLSTNPNVITIYDLGIADDGRPYIVMELLEGQSLRTVVESKRGGKTVSRSFVTDVGLHVSAALIDAHAKGISHRDLKPENIFYIQTWTVQELIKVLDFGVARADSHRLPDGMRTAVGAIIGSPGYIAPEAVEGPAIPSSDIYSMGIVLYELATGHRPFKAQSALGQLLARLKEDPIPLAKRGAGSWPDSFQSLLWEMLDCDPEKRPTAEELRRRLLAINREIEIGRSS